jgi:pilus assembly protein Flp/PilA
LLPCGGSPLNWGWQARLPEKNYKIGRSFLAKKLFPNSYFKTSTPAGLVFIKKNGRINKSLYFIYFFTWIRNLCERRDTLMLFSLQERGQGMVEYALILVFVALVVIAVLTITGPIVGNTYSTINSKL